VGFGVADHWDGYCGEGIDGEGCCRGGGVVGAGSVDLGRDCGSYELTTFFEAILSVREDPKLWLGIFF
jgi:hypothetical protein